jgi:hypothetical protein
MVQRPVPVIENANAVPKPGLLSFPRVSILAVGKTGGATNLWVWEVDQSRLVGVVGLLQVVHHQMAMSWRSLLAHTGREVDNQRTYRDNPTRLRSFRPASRWHSDTRRPWGNPRGFSGPSSSRSWPGSSWGSFEGRARTKPSHRRGCPSAQRGHLLRRVSHDQLRVMRDCVVELPRDAIPSWIQTASVCCKSVCRDDEKDWTGPRAGPGGP